MVDTVSQDVVAAAKAIGPLIRATQEELESTRRLPEPVVSAMNDAGLFQLFFPRTLGGPEIDPITAFLAVEEISKADGSAGWCSMLSSVGALMMGSVRTDVAERLFEVPSEFRCAGSFRPEGEALKVDGGYRVTGRWNYASGINHATWLFFNCQITDENGPCQTPEGVPVTRLVVISVKDVTIEDTWFTVGMRGTGSNDFVVEALFVPDEQSFSLFEPTPEQGPHYVYGPRSFFVLAHGLVAANSLGMARGAMDTFLELANATGTTASPIPLRDRLAVQKVVGEAEAMISGARAYVLDTLGTVWQAYCDGKPDPSYEIAQARLAVTHGMWQSLKAVDMLFHAAGTNAIHRRNQLERYFRDIHVAVQHVAGLPSNYETGGKIMLGLPTSETGW